MPTREAEGEAEGEDEDEEDPEAEEETSKAETEEETAEARNENNRSSPATIVEERDTRLSSARVRRNLEGISETAGREMVKEGTRKPLR